MTISKNVAACIRGIRLIGDGDEEAANKVMEGCTDQDLRDACEILEALWAEKIVEIKDRFPPADGETVRDIIQRASAAGDEDAKTLIQCGILEVEVY